MADSIRFSFGEAIEHIKSGRLVAREGWNGKNMFIFWGLPRIEINSPKEPVTAEDAADSFRCSYQDTGCIAMMTAQKTIQVGWLASQSDMLAEDWCIVEHK